MRELSVEEVQQVELRLLRRADRHCREQGLTYYLARGSLLGAVRHGGFIPWDDDADIWLPRASYEAFIESFEEDEVYRLIRPFDERYRFAWAKVVDKRTAYFNPGRVEPDDYGVSLDLFPLDDFQGQRRLKRAIRVTTLRNIAWNRPHRGVPRTAKQRLKDLLGPLVRLLPASWYDGRAWARIVAPPEEEGSAFYVNYHARRDAWDREVFDKEWFGTGVLAPFGQDDRFVVPARPQDVLARRYGPDWQTPVVYGRHAHAYLRDGQEAFGEELARAVMGAGEARSTGATEGQC